MSRAVSDTKSQTAALMSKIIAEHDSLRTQEYDATARPLRTGQHAARKRKRKSKRTTSQVQQQQHTKGFSQDFRTTSQVQQQQHITGVSTGTMMARLQTTNSRTKRHGTLVHLQTTTSRTIQHSTCTISSSSMAASGRLIQGIKMIGRGPIRTTKMKRDASRR